jgi:hypothetical protein
MSEHFIVEWQDEDMVRSAQTFVSLRMNGRKAGLYRVRQVMPQGVLLSHGAISFPVGTQLDLEDVLGIMPGGGSHARVVSNDTSGLRLAW